MIVKNMRHFSSGAMDTDLITVWGMNTMGRRTN